MNRCYSKCKAVLVGVSVLVLSGITTLKAQEVVDEAQLQMYFGLGSGTIRLGTLNESVKKLGFPEFSKKPFNFEMGTHFVIQQLVLDGGVGTFLWKSRVVDDNRASLFGGYTQLSLGVNFVLPGEAWQLYPYFTLGVGVYRYSLTQMYEFDDGGAKSTEQQNNAYWLPTFITGTGGALYYTSYNAEKTRAFTIGIRGGVLMDPTRQTTWYKNGSKYRDGPSPLFAGPYVQFIIASGRYFK
jgi:hypothetical protein